MDKRNNKKDNILKQIIKGVEFKEMERKKILHLVESFGGGVYTYLVDLTNVLIQNYDVIIAYSKRIQTPSDFKNDFNDKIKFIEVKAFSRNIGKNDIKALKEVKEIINQEKPDIVHVHSTKAGVIGRMAVNNKNIKLFYTPHGYSFLKQDDSYLKRALYRFTEKWVTDYRKECTTIACSYGEYKHAIRLDKNAIYINNGINTNGIDAETIFPYSFTLL